MIPKLRCDFLWSSVKLSYLLFLLEHLYILKGGREVCVCVCVYVRERYCLEKMQDPALGDLITDLSCSRQWAPHNEPGMSS